VGKKKRVDGRATISRGAPFRKRKRPGVFAQGGGKKVAGTLRFIPAGPKEGAQPTADAGWTEGRSKRCAFTHGVERGGNGDKTKNKLSRIRTSRGGKGWGARRESFGEF